MKRLGFFGGTFNPPHRGHVLTLKHVMDTFDLDLTLVIPAFIPPHKSTSSNISFENRYEMTKLAFKTMKNVIVSDLEFRRGGKSYTYESIKEISKLYQAKDIYVIIGSDSYNSFTTWHNWRGILNKVCLIVLQRPGYIMKNDLLIERYAIYDGNGIIFLQNHPLDISSTDIRLQKKFFFLDESVKQYIADHHLYED